MGWTKKQRSFMTYYYGALRKKTTAATNNDIAEVCIAFYLEAEDEAEKERAAYLLLTIFSVEQLACLDELLDVEELYEYAAAKQRKVKNSAKLANEKRHLSRGDSFLTDQEWEKAVQHFDHKCAYCGKQDKLTFEHVVPFSKGGRFDRQNIIPACSACNASKNNLDFYDWFHNQAFYDKAREQRIFLYLKQENHEEKR